MATLLVTNCAFAGQNGSFDILVENGLISIIRPQGGFKDELANQNIKKIDAAGNYAVPGLVDIHVHLREPGFEGKETIATGSAAALVGGFTDICCMANTKPVNDSPQVTTYINNRAKLVDLCHVHPIGAVTLGLKSESLAPLSLLRKAGCVAFSDDGEPVHNANMMKRALEWCVHLDAPILCHEEEKSITAGGAVNDSRVAARLGLPAMAAVGEEVMIARDIELARSCKGRVHICHVSTARGVELVRRAKNDGIKITAEVTPHHLFLSESNITKYDTNYKMSPPLRTEEDVAGCIAGVRDGTIDAIASDHAPHDIDSKDLPFAEATFGITGLQTMLPLTLQLVRSGDITLHRWTELLSLNPSGIVGIEQNKIVQGAKANFAIVDMKQQWQLSHEILISKSKNTPFVGAKLTGQVKHVLVDGILKVSDGKII